MRPFLTRARTPALVGTSELLSWRRTVAEKKRPSVNPARENSRAPENPPRITCEVAAAIDIMHQMLRGSATIEMAAIRFVPISFPIYQLPNAPQRPLDPETGHGQSRVAALSSKRSTFTTISARSGTPPSTTSSTIRGRVLEPTFPSSEGKSSIRMKVESPRGCPP